MQEWTYESSGLVFTYHFSIPFTAINYIYQCVCSFTAISYNYQPFNYEIIFNHDN